MRDEVRKSRAYLAKQSSLSPRSPRAAVRAQVTSPPRPPEARPRAGAHITKGPEVPGQGSHQGPGTAATVAALPKAPRPHAGCECRPPPASVRTGDWGGPRAAVLLDTGANELRQDVSKDNGKPPNHSLLGAAA